MCHTDFTKRVTDFFIFTEREFSYFIRILNIYQRFGVNKGTIFLKMYWLLSGGTLNLFTPVHLQ